MQRKERSRYGSDLSRFPILPGKTAEAQEFHRELDGPRKSEYEDSERRIGITKEVWYVAPILGGEALVAYIETQDFAKALSMFVESREEFDMWFRRRLLEVTGLDLNNPPDLTLPEVVSSYEAS
jgi:hypothetical protein